MRVATLRPEFVDSIPADLEDGVLYISIPFRTTIHLCACGCRTKTVMPIRPGAWTITYDGDTVSMSPSVGNQELPCGSHYWIESGRVHWMHDWRPTHGSKPQQHRRTEPDAPIAAADHDREPAHRWRRFRTWLTRPARR
jgi:hypothetical protein